MKSLINRRTLLRGSVGGAAVALALPRLEIFNNLSHAAPTADDPIFGVFFWGNGLPWHAGHGEEQGSKPEFVDLWTPAATGPDYAPSPLLKILAAHRPSVVTGLEPHTDIPDAPPGQDDGHIRGFMVSLTSDRMRSELYDYVTFTATALQPTLDQLVANHPRFYRDVAPRFRSLVLGVNHDCMLNYGHWRSISYNGPESLNPPITDPTQFYKLLFTAPPDLPDVAARVRLLDAIHDDAASLRVHLPAGDRQRLDAHLEHLSEVQRRLALSVGVCDAAPAVPVPVADLHAHAELMADLLAVALECGLTRVFSFMFTPPATTHIFNNIESQFGGPVQVDMHSVCHKGEWETVRRISEYQLQGFARVLDRLQASVGPDDRTLLDRACILGTSEYGEGWKHSVKETPTLAVGGAAGALRRGVHVREPGGNLSKFHLTLLRAIGLDLPTFGFHGGETDEEFPELRA
ncbi:MAG: DUF1552 domain-containing protein [Myxococcales bacterium]|nr:DUF1552 domain-containing protein [Myxococcales bacterium]